MGDVTGHSCEDIVNEHKKVADRDRMNSERCAVQSRTVLSDNWATLERVVFDYRRGDGQWQTQQREIYHRGHGAAVLLYNLKKRSIVLTRQFRFPAWTLGGDGFLLEVPAGIIEGDNPAKTVQAETLQETGFQISEPEFLFKAFATPGSVTEQLYYYRAAYESADRIGQGGGLPEEGEDIEVLEVSVEWAADAITTGEIQDAKTILLIQHSMLCLFGINT